LGRLIPVSHLKIKIISPTMTLTTPVKESLDAAAATLREALAFAARTEKPITIHTLTDILMRLESLEHMDELMCKFGAPSTEKTGL
jgi:predicted metal-dependent phosphotriesterase family hydrolase